MGKSWDLECRLEKESLALLRICWMSVASDEEPDWNEAVRYEIQVGGYAAGPLGPLCDTACIKAYSIVVQHPRRSA
jgi:hypothetical protein